MSTYNTNRARMAACVTALMTQNMQLTQTDTQLLAFRQSGWDSRRLAEYSGELLKMREPQNLVLQSARITCGDNLVNFAKERYQTPNLADSVKVMAENMAHLEFRAISSVAESTLKEQQFSTRIVQRGDRCAIEASGKNNAKLLVLIENKGAQSGVGIKTDWANLADRSCLKMNDEFERGLAKNGVSTMEKDRIVIPHFRPGGGQLMAAAGKMHAPNLAAGILDHEENNKSFVPKMFHDDRGHTPRRRNRA